MRGPLIMAGGLHMHGPTHTRDMLTQCRLAHYGSPVCKSTGAQYAYACILHFRHMHPVDKRLTEHVCVCVCVCVFLSVWRTCGYVCVCVCVCVCTWVYVYVCVTGTADGEIHVFNSARVLTLCTSGGLVSLPQQGSGNSKQQTAAGQPQLSAAEVCVYTHAYCMHTYASASI